MLPIYEVTAKGVSAFINNKEQYVLLKMEGDVSDQEYKKAFEMLLDKEKTQNYNRLLINQENLNQVSASARAWLLMKFMPMAQQHFGTNFKVAIVRSLSPLQKLASKLLLGSLMQINPKFQIQYFDDRIQAREWLIK
jgi:hypothetical protein